MSEPSPLRRILRFGAYQCDLSAGELHKNGIKVKLSDQPFRLLVILLERRGEVATRQELGERLWPAGTFVCYEDGLNTAIKKLRVALDDQSENPRFLETIPRRGYRFIAPVEEVAGNGNGAGRFDATREAGDATRIELAATSPNGVATAAPVAAALPEAHLAVTAKMSRWGWPAVTAIAALGTFALWWNMPLPPPRVTRVEQITTSGRIDTPVRPVTDGAHVYYIERNGGHWDLMQVPVNGGEERVIDFPERSAMPMDFSVRAAVLLVGRFASRNDEPELWSVPEESGAAARLGDIRATTAAYSPDGKEIAYSNGETLWMVNADGSGARKLATLPENAAWLTWSPDGAKLRFTIGGLLSGGRTSLWEISRDGRNLHPLLAGWNGGTNECCGSWTADGRYYIFTAYHNGRSNLWALREEGSWWRRSSRGPFQMTFGPDSPWGGTPSRDGREIFFYNGVWREEIEQFDAKTAQLLPPDVDGKARQISYSRDHKWMAYVDAQSRALFRSRIDGSERIELTPGKMSASFPRWSPDGKWIAFDAALPEGGGNAYVVAASGGSVEPLLPGGVHLRDADWSGDGKSLVASEEPASIAETRKLVTIDFATRKATEIPGSEALAMSRWSYDGRLISATTEDQTQMKLWDVEHRKWSVIAHGAALGISVWSPDSRYLYFQDLLGKGEPLSRYDVRSGRIEKVGDFSAALREGADRCALDSLSPNGAPIMLLNRGALDLFTADMNLP